MSEGNGQVAATKTSPSGKKEKKAGGLGSQSGHRSIDRRCAGGRRPVAPKAFVGAAEPWRWLGRGRLAV